MFKNVALAWTVAVIALVGMAGFAIRTERAERRASDAEAILGAQKNLADAAKDLQSAIFVRADDATITFRLPRQAEVDGSTFVDYVEQTAPLSANLDVFGTVSQEDGRLQLMHLPEGSAIRIKLVLDLQSNTSSVEAVYIAP